MLGLSATGSPSTVVIKSPTRIPAVSAAPPGTTSVTRQPPWRASPSTPIRGASASAARTPDRSTIPTAFIAACTRIGVRSDFLYNALRQRLHPIPAALIQAVVFGCVHPFGLANSVGIGVAAVALAAVYEWRKSLLTPILVHAAMNAAIVGAGPGRAHPRGQEGGDGAHFSQS